MAVTLSLTVIHFKGQKRGIMAGSFFEMSNMSFTQIVGILHHFAKETSVLKAALSLELNKVAVVYWYKASKQT